MKYYKECSLPVYSYQVIFKNYFFLMCVFCMLNIMVLTFKKKLIKFSLEGSLVKTILEILSILFLNLEYQTITFKFFFFVNVRLGFHP